MAKYALTRKAVKDLSEIWNYSVEVWSEYQADKYYYMLIGTCEALGSKKIAGKPYPEIHCEVSGYKIGQHVIFYRTLKGGKIEITRILHSRMDLKNRIHE